MSSLRFKNFTDILDRYIDARTVWIANGRQIRGAVHEDYVRAKQNLNKAVAELVGRYP